MTEEDFFGGVNKPVDEFLVKVFIKLGLIKQTGHGVPKVVRKYGAKAYDFGTSTITVTIPFDRSGFKDKRENATVNATENATVKLSETEKSILRLISEDNAITIEGLSEKIGKHRTTILRALGQLREKGLVERVGPDKTGHWEIKE